MTPADLARLREDERTIVAHLQSCRIGGGSCSHMPHTVVLDLIVRRLALARAVVGAARNRLELEGHDPACAFRGCTCDPYDHAKAARQDVQRALLAHDAEAGR